MDFACALSHPNISHGELLIARHGQKENCIQRTGLLRHLQTGLKETVDGFRTHRFFEKNRLKSPKNL